MTSIFLLKSRQFHLHELPSWLDYQEDYFCFSDDISDIPIDTSSFFEDDYICCKLVQEYLMASGWEGISDSWNIKGAFATRSEAEEFAKKTAHKYKLGYKISCCEPIGSLLNLLKNHVEQSKDEPANTVHQ